MPTKQGSTASQHQRVNRRHLDLCRSRSETSIAKKRTASMVPLVLSTDLPRNIRLLERKYHAINELTISAVTTVMTFIIKHSGRCPDVALHTVGMFFFF